MAGNDVALVRRQFQQLVEALQHFADMKRRRERTLARHILIEMADVGSEHDKTPAGPDANELQPGRMAACGMYRKARSQLAIAIVEQDAARIVEPHNPADILDLE